MWETQACIIQLTVSLPAFLVSLARGTEHALTHIYITCPKPHKVLCHPCQPPFEAGQDSNPSVQEEKARPFSHSLGPIILLSLTSRQISLGDSQWYFCRSVGSTCTLCTEAQFGSLTLALTHISTCGFSCFGPCIPLSLLLYSLSSDFRGRLFMPSRFQHILPASPKASPFVFNS